MPEDDRLALLIADVYEAAGAARRAGEGIAARAGQTQARWQVLSVVGEGDWTVPAAARRLGVTRQAVQRTVDLLAADGLVALEPNPAHRRSSFVRLTADGRRALRTITRRAERWNDTLAARVSVADLAAARRVLRAIAAAGDAADDA